MKRRLKVNGKGELVDREGVVVGRIVGMTIEVDGGDIGGEEPSLTTEGGVDRGPGKGGEAEQLATGPIPVEILNEFGGPDEKRKDAYLVASAVNAVWGHYAAVMQPRSKEPDGEQRKIIRDALKVATVAECKRAIDGCAASEFHMGQNENRKKYNRLSQILKGKRGGKTTREQIDMFLESAENSGLQSHVTSATHARVRQARRDVLDGWEFPNDARVVERANEAKAWLRREGWTITYGENGRPEFTEPS